MFGFGVLIGIIATQIIFRVFLVGVLHVDAVLTEDEPYMFLELSKSVKAIVGKTHIILKVNTKGFASHK